MVASWCWGFCDHPDVGIRGAPWPESALGPPPLLRTLLHLTLVSACGYECVSISGRSLKCPLNVACGEEQGLRRQTGLALRRWPCDLGEVVSLPGPHGCASEQARGKTMGGGTAAGDAPRGLPAFKAVPLECARIPPPQRTRDQHPGRWARLTQSSPQSFLGCLAASRASVSLQLCGVFCGPQGMCRPFCPGPAP